MMGPLETRFCQGCGKVLLRYRINEMLLSLQKRSCIRMELQVKCKSEGCGAENTVAVVIEAPKLESSPLKS